MANIFPVELLGIFMVFYTSYKLKLQRYIISLLLKNHIIYLPFNNDDYNQLVELARENKVNKKQDKFIIRSCEFEEYSEKAQSLKYHDLEFLIFLFFCNFTIYFFNILYKILRLVILGKERGPFLLNEDNKNSNNEESNEGYNFSIYLSLSLIIYIIFRELLANGLKNKATKEFILCLISCFCLFFFNEYYNEKFFNLNYESSCNIINNRIDIILTKSNANFNIDINKLHVKILFSILFGLMTAILYKSVKRGAYFDNLFCKISNESNTLNIPKVGADSKNNSQVSEQKGIMMENISKFKSIANLIISIILINPLLDNFLELVNINNNIKKLVAIFILIIIDFISGFFIFRNSYFIFSVQNYQEILKFAHNLNQKNLVNHQQMILNINEYAWDVLSNIFINYFLPFFVFICYLIEIDIFGLLNKINDNEDTKLNKGFIDNVFYVIFLGIVFSKGILQNAIFYFRLIIGEKHLVLV